MAVYITDETIERVIKEDVPYIDLTTLLLNIAGQPGRIEFMCREEAILCGTEEVARIFRKLDINPTYQLPSGTKINPGTIVAAGEGAAENLHMAWKAAQNILEYSSGIATRTARLLAQARSTNPQVELVTTRKVFPGTKELSVKAVIAGGGLPHRLGLSETILIFAQHLNFVGGMDVFTDRLASLKARCPEKKIIIEVTEVEEAIKACKAGVDGVQFDKMAWTQLAQAVELLRVIKPEITILAAGGINESNADKFAQTGVDAIVTSAVYFGKPIDIGTKIEQR